MPICVGLSNRAFCASHHSNSFENEPKFAGTVQLPLMGWSRSAELIRNAFLKVKKFSNFFCYILLTFLFIFSSFPSSAFDRECSLENNLSLLHRLIDPPYVEFSRNGYVVATGESKRSRLNFVDLALSTDTIFHVSNVVVEYVESQDQFGKSRYVHFKLKDKAANGSIIIDGARGRQSLYLQYINEKNERIDVFLYYNSQENLEEILTDVACLIGEKYGE